MNRRIFLASGAGWTVAKALPSDLLRLGVIGTGGRGISVMREFQKDTAVRVEAVCDVYQPNLEKAAAAAAEASGARPRPYSDYRKLLAEKNIDAVLVATPEHWHHRMVLDALAAGKDIYIEKPLCQTPEQGVELAEAEKRSRQIIQVGMQRRSYDLYLEGRKVVASGRLGNVRMVRCWWLNNYLGSARVDRLDGALDWEQWQGPVRKRVPLDPDRFRNWRYYSDYAGGILADQGAHVFDGVHLLMNAGFPRAVNATANRPHRSGFDTPESVVAAAEYAEDFMAVFTINYAAMKYQSRNDQLNQLDGDQARMDIGREEFRVYDQANDEKPALALKSEKGFGYATELHVRNFLECVRSRKPPTAPVRLGFQAVLVVQLANLSLKLGKRVRWDDTKKAVVA